MLKEYRSPLSVKKLLKQLKIYQFKDIDIVIESAGEFYNIAMIEYNEEYNTVILHAE